MLKVFITIISVISITILNSFSYNTSYHNFNLNASIIPSLPREDGIVVLENYNNTETIQENRIEPNGKWVLYYAKTTGYTPGAESCYPYADGKTSIGVNTKSPNPDHIYGIAANPRVLPYGTKVYVEDYSRILQSNRSSVPSTPYQKIDDTGGDMRRFRPHYRTVNGKRVLISFHIDLRFRTVKAAQNWGVRYVPVMVWKQN